jgi:hypothetical protein
MFKKLIFITFLFSNFSGSAQQVFKNENTYRNQANTYYWKNKMPDAAYWQQDVHYAIKAKIDEIDHRIDANETLTYWNNSLDTLHYVYFHLFQNAFVKGSYLRALEKTNKVKSKLGKKEAEGKGIVINTIQINNKQLKTELDNTILKVYLDEPLLPESKVAFDIDFSTYYDKGSTRRRMQMYDAWGFKHYNGVQWFPKISVYDRKFGWDTYQHLNKEFYSDFGSYDVELNFPSNYIVEATGVLENRNQVLPDTLRNKLDIKNFANKPWNEAPSIIIPYVKGERKTWKFHADNVHDFAFTADPSYRIATEYWNGVECVGLAQEPHASGWQNSASYVAKIIATFSKDFGMYAYPKMIAADANDGMEYPMLTLDGGRAPSYNGLLVHEIGHNWFYGMVGSNETYRAAMDEGFTQFLTAWGLGKIDGPIIPAAKTKSKWKNKYAEPQRVIDKSVFNAYHMDALNKDEVPLNTHSDDFNGALGHGGGYRQVYYKSASMLYNLQYVLGDSLFSAAMQHYFHQWKIAHPYFEDFKNSIIQFTKVDLNWFFDQWFETTKSIDYSISKIKKTKEKDQYELTFKRKGDMQMPLDFTVKSKDGQFQNYVIPNTWFAKSTNATILPKWIGWGKLNPSYKATIQIANGLKEVVIDTSKRLVDINPLNNSKRNCLPINPSTIKIHFNNYFNNTPTDRHKYRANINGDYWWNAVDGFKLGVSFEGDYFKLLHQIDGRIWWNTRLGQLDKYKNLETDGLYSRYIPVNYTFNYKTPLMLSNPKLKLFVNSRLLDGLWLHRGGVSWDMNRNNSISIFAQSQWRSFIYDADYLLYQNEWSSFRSRPNSAIQLNWFHSYQGMTSKGRWNVQLRAPFLTGNQSQSFDYSYLQAEWLHVKPIHKLLLKTRFFGRYGTGKNLPSESMLFAAGANPEELMENKFTRSVGIIPESWKGNYSSDNINHFQHGGGLNLRGYAGYLIADAKKNLALIGYKGKSGAAVNVELEFGNYIKLKPKFTKNWLSLTPYLFADAGTIQLSSYDSLSNYWNTKSTNYMSNIRMDAGLGMVFTIKKFGLFDKAKPLILRLDMPFFINRPPHTNSNYFDFRYVIGINRAF